jgi:hypothetical protein
VVRIISTTPWEGKENRRQDAWARCPQQFSADAQNMRAGEHHKVEKPDAALFPLELTSLTLPLAAFN